MFVCKISINYLFIGTVGIIWLLLALISIGGGIGAMLVRTLEKEAKEHGGLTLLVGTDDERP